MAELMMFNPVEAFGRGQEMGQRNALLRREREMQEKRPGLIQNALTSGDTRELFALDPQTGAKTQAFLSSLNEQERAEFARKHQESANLVEWVESLPQEQRPKAWQMVAPRINDAWGGQVIPTSYDPMASGMILAQARGVSQMLGDVPAGLQEFQAMTKGMSPEEIERARRIRLGLEGRASNAGYTSRTVLGADGRERVVLIDPRTGMVIATQGDEFTSPTEEESAADKARGTVRGRTEAEREANRSKVMASIERMGARADRVSRLVESIKPRVSNFTAGMIGQRLSDIPGTPQRDLAADLQTLQAIAGFGELEEMRANSPTGGALGAVSERELALLQSTIANIEQSQSPQQLQRNLELFEQAVRGAWERVRRAAEIDYGPQNGGGEDSPPQPKRRRYNPATGTLE